jgi:hypothetical protein
LNLQNVASRQAFGKEALIPFLGPKLREAWDNLESLTAAIFYSHFQHKIQQQLQDSSSSSQCLFFDYGRSKLCQFSLPFSGLTGKRETAPLRAPPSHNSCFAAVVLVNCDAEDKDIEEKNGMNLWLKLNLGLERGQISAKFLLLVI